MPSMQELFTQWQLALGGLAFCYLTAFVALASAALFIGAGKSINSIWTTANSQLANAATSAS